MKSKNLSTILILFLCVVLQLNPVRAANKDVKVTACWASGQVIERLVRPFNEQNPTAPVVFKILDDDRISEELSSGRCVVGIRRGLWDVPDQHRFSKAFGDTTPLTRLPLGRYAVYVVVNEKNSLKQIHVDYLAKIYRGLVRDWGDVPGGRKGRPIHIFSPPFNDTGYHIVKSRSLRGYDFDKRLRDWSAKPVRMKTTSDGVLTAVNKDENAIGFFLFDHRAFFDKRIRVLGICPRRGKEAIFPSEETVFQNTYPLCQDLTMWVHPNGPPAAYEFCKFLTDPQNRDILREHNLYPECDQFAYFAEKRLKKYKAGKGPRVLAMGLRSGQALMQDLVLDYVKAKAVVQLSYSTTTGGVVPIAQFLQGRREVLLLDGPPSAKAMRIHGAKWRKTKPTEHILAGRAVAIVVHATNKLNSLTLPQIRGIFAGEITDWRHLAAMGEQAMADTRIHRFGVRRASRTAELFHRKAMTGKKNDPLMHRMTTNKVLSSLAADPQGIGFLGAGHLPDDPAKAGLKVLAIVPPASLGTAGKTKPIKPTPENVLAGKYPIAERLHLYVSPKASQATQDFITYITTPGNAVDTFQKHELLPKPKPKPKPTLKPKAKVKPKKSTQSKSPTKPKANKAPAKVQKVTPPARPTTKPTS